ncbi:MAG: LPXTG cell wall anchor domain-containing protein [bacterium]|nr:LPXTG cell wall anchor domain-containing protein [bacterium]
MKNIAKYGIVLLSVAVLGATTTVSMTVSADDVAPAAAETPAPAVSKVKVGIFYGVNSQNPVKEWNIELREGESYTAEAPSIAGYKFVMGAHYDGGQVREFHTKTYTIKYMSFQGLPENQTLAFYYEPENPGENPGQNPGHGQNPGENPTPTQTQTQKFNINYWALRAGGGATHLGTETVEVSPGEAHTVEQKEFPGYEFQGASIDNGATGTDVELPYNLKYGDNNQGIDLIYKKKSQNPGKDPEKPNPGENPGKDPEKPAEAKLPDTGTKDNSFASFAMAVVALIAGVLLSKKKN